MKNGKKAGIIGSVASITVLGAIWIATPASRAESQAQAPVHLTEFSSMKATTPAEPAQDCLREQLRTPECSKFWASVSRSSIAPFFPAVPNFSTGPWRHMFAWQAFAALNWPAHEDMQSPGQANWFQPTGTDDTKPTVWLTWPDITDVVGEDHDYPVWGTYKPGYRFKRVGDHWIRINGHNTPFEIFPTENSPLAIIPQATESSPKPSGVCAVNRQKKIPKHVYDTNGNRLVYKTQMNQVAFRYIQKEALYNHRNQQARIQNQIDSQTERPVDFPAGCEFKDGREKRGAIFVKSAWKQLSKNDIHENYYVRHGVSIAGKQGTFTIGLVGLHFAIKVQTEKCDSKKKIKNKQWIWLTYEHVNAAPDSKNREERCSGKFDCTMKFQCTPSKNSNKESDHLFDLRHPECLKSCRQRCPDHADAGHCKAICSGNHWSTSTKSCPITQVTRLEDWEIEIPRWQNHRDVLCKHLMRKREGAPPLSSAWHYYRLIGAQWKLAGSERDANPKTGTHEPQPSRLANVAIETFSQNEDGCDTCHVNRARSHKDCEDEHALKSLDLDSVIGLRRAWPIPEETKQHLKKEERQ